MSASSSRPGTPISASKPVTEASISHPAHKLLARAHPNDLETATKTFTEKIVHKPLLLSQSTDHTDKRAARRRTRERKKVYASRHARPKPLSAREKRMLKLYELRPEECRYKVYKGLNQFWRRYILEVLGYLDRNGKPVPGKIGSANTASGAGALIASADFHGMEVEVVRCADTARVGIKGIVVRETRSTFTVVMDEKEDKHRQLNKLKAKGTPGESTQEGHIISSKAQTMDKVRTILKKGTVFRVFVDLPTIGEGSAVEGRSESQTSGSVLSTGRKQLVFELHGSQLEIRPPERSTKKFKWQPMEYL